MVLNFLVALLLIVQLTQPIDSIVTVIKSNRDSPQRKITNSFGPVLKSESALVMDMASGKILFEKNGFQQRSIASLTKLMTAMVFLDNQPEWERVIEIKDDDRLNGGRVVFIPGEKVRLKDLFEATLIGSLNNGAIALAQASDKSMDEFVRQMNIKAKELGMQQTHFVEPSGIDAENYSTAMDVAILLRSALQYDLIRQALSRTDYTVRSVDGRVHRIKNTNKLLGSYLDIMGGKTGYIEEAGFCLANLVRSQRVSAGIIVVILGAPTKEDRFQENKFLSQWVFDNWEWN